jgi:hypothetical protein
MGIARGIEIMTHIEEANIEDSLDELLINLYGPPGSGKTWCALTLSKKWPKDILAPRKRIITLDDVLHLQWDRAADIGLGPHKVRPKYKLNCAAMVGEYGFPKALAHILKDTKEMVHANDKIRVVVHDTVTAMDKYSFAHYRRRTEVSVKTGKEDVRAVFGNHLQTHLEYQTEMSTMPAGVQAVFLFHEKVVDEDSVNKMSKAESAKLKAKKLGDHTVYIFPAGTGSGINYYTNDSSLELFITAKKLLDKKGEPKGRYQRELHPISSEGRRTKNRFQHLLKESMEPNLRTMLDMVIKECK